MKFIVGQRVVKEGEDSRFEGQVVACFVKRDLKTLRYVVENDGVLHIASERQLRLAMPTAPRAA
jgi:transcription elongation factor